MTKATIKEFEEEQAAEIAHFWSEYTDDKAPLNEKGVYLPAAKRFLEKFTVHKKEY